MTLRPNPRARLLALAAGLLIAVCAAAALSGGRARGAVAPPSLTVGGQTVGPPVPAGFVGLATEYWNVEQEVGTDPTRPDRAFEQALLNLAPEGGFNLRIGGDSTDWSWWPIPGMKQPPWVRFTITPTWAAVTARLAADLHAHVIVGLNMEAGNVRIDQAEVRGIGHALSRQPLTFELGNEPELYSHFPFYHTPAGIAVRGRPKTYTLLDMASQWNQLAAGLPGVRLAGPGYTSLASLPYVNAFLTDSHRLGLLTVHTYPLRSTRCAAARPQDSELFTPPSLQGLASGLAAWESLARRHGIGLRVDEMNSITCGGQPGVTNTLGPALWALNILPLYAQAGINGVNIQSRPFTAQNLIQTTDTSAGWRVRVQPEYYGLLAFAQLTPPGSRMLRTGALPNGLYAWADRTPQGQMHVVITNVGPAPRRVSLRGGAGPGSVETLTGGAGGLAATGGVRLGGRALSEQTGQLDGPAVTQTVSPHAGVYTVTVAPASATVLTVRG
ncbi:MAG TPA: hypothetical protein VFN36_05655 [Solirubrobacteraceae bacterium]|nr:hypothetical protein [Solirubrobacteraceae bacterium]